MSGTAIVLRVISVILVGYLLGSIPFGLLIGRRVGVDVRQTGSGKTGATNVMRSAGIGPGLLVAFGDALKGAVPVLISQHWLASPAALGIHNTNIGPLAAAAAGLASIAGHNYSIYIGFKGGRGVATTGGMALAIATPAALIALIFLIVPIVLTRYVSLGSMIAAASLPLIELVLMKTGTVGYDGPASFFALLVAAIAILFSHHDNIQRLMAGTERQIGKKVPAQQSRPTPAN